jgi:hypothetical protein
LIFCVLDRQACSWQSHGRVMAVFSASGEVPEWPKGADCKSAGEAFGGSNPPLSTTQYLQVGDSGIKRKRSLSLELHPVYSGSSESANGRALLLFNLQSRAPTSHNGPFLEILTAFSTAHVAQLVEHFLGKEEVHRFDPGRGLHFPNSCEKADSATMLPLGRPLFMTLAESGFWG